MRKLIFLFLAVLIFTGMDCDEFDPTESTRVRGRLWRDMKDGKITQEEYQTKSRMLGELDDQWEAQLKRFKEIEGEDYFEEDGGCGGMTRIDPPDLNGVNIQERRANNRAAMEDFRRRIITRGREIYDWDPNAGTRTSQAVMPGSGPSSEGVPVSFGDDLGGQFVSNDSGLARDVQDGFGEGQVHEHHKGV